jgi:hypothetical protein
LRPTWPRIVILLCIVLGAGIAAGVGLVGHIGPSIATPATQPATDASDQTEMQRKVPGPWGNLRTTRIVTEPLESAAAALIPSEPTTWVLPQQSPVGVERMMTDAGIPAPLIARIAPTIVWDPATAASIVTPAADVVLAIPAEARAAFYKELARYPANQYQAKPFRFRKTTADQWFDGSSLTAESKDVLRRLSYSRGDTVFISDVPAACELIASKQQQAQVLKALSRTSTLMIDLLITPDSDIDALTAYWGFGKRLRNVRPLLESVSRVPRGYSMDIAHLLPRFARKRLYAYPARDGRSLDPPYDCHWSSMNFWNDPPDDRLSDTEFVVHTIMNDYEKVPQDKWRFGDVILLGESEDQLIHSCVYIAADIVFTKNGPSHLTPWVFMEIDDLLAYYEMPGRSALRAYRPKEATEQ